MFICKLMQQGSRPSWPAAAPLCCAGCSALGVVGQPALQGANRLSPRPCIDMHTHRDICRKHVALSIHATIMREGTSPTCPSAGAGLGCAPNEAASRPNYTCSAQRWIIEASLSCSSFMRESPVLRQAHARTLLAAATLAGALHSAAPMRRPHRLPRLSCDLGSQLLSAPAAPEVPGGQWQ